MAWFSSIMSDIDRVVKKFTNIRLKLNPVLCTSVFFKGFKVHWTGKQCNKCIIWEKMAIHFIWKFPERISSFKNIVPPIAVFESPSLRTCIIWICNGFHSSSTVRYVWHLNNALSCSHVKAFTFWIVCNFLTIYFLYLLEVLYWYLKYLMYIVLLYYLWITFWDNIGGITTYNYKRSVIDFILLKIYQFKFLCKLFNIK